MYDNRLAPSSPDAALTTGGLLFTAPADGGGTQEINIFGNGGANNYSFYVGTGAGSYSLQLTGGTFTITEQPPTIVPIPPAAWLFTSGLFGMAGLRRRFGKQAAAL
jgi:hypothetical protein